MGPTSSQDAKRLVQELGSSIQKTLAESSQITLCLSRLKAEGYDVSLLLEATVGLHRRASRQQQPAAELDYRVDTAEPAPLQMTPLDKKFLRSLKISVEDEE